MEFLRFIKWQWNRINRDDKAFLTVVLLTISSIGYTVYTGSSVGTIILTAIGTLVFGVMLWAIFLGIEKQWNLYKKIREKEAEER